MSKTSRVLSSMRRAEKKTPLGKHEDIFLPNLSGVPNYIEANNLLNNGYAGISAVNNSTETSIATVDTWTQVAIFDTNNPSKNSTPDHTNNHITVGSTGDYQINFSASVTGAANGKVWRFGVFKNNGATITQIQTDRKIGTGGDVGALGSSGIETCTEDDTIELWVQNTTDATNITFNNVNLHIEQLA